MPPFTLGNKRGPGGSTENTDDLTPAGGRAFIRQQDLGGTGQTDAGPPQIHTDEPVATGGTGAGGHNTREFPLTYDVSPSVGGPLGPMNIGYIHNIVSTNAQWGRGNLPDLGYGYAFALRRPRFMREPRTDLGSYNFARG